MKNAAKHLLHLADVLTNCHLTAQRRAHMLGTGQVVRVGMGFQNPRHLPALLAHVVNQYITGRRTEAA